MTNPIDFSDLVQAMAYCKEASHQVTVSIAGTLWRLFPSGSSLTMSERLFHELDARQQEQVIATYTGKDLHQFAYNIKVDGAVVTRRALNTHVPNVRKRDFEILVHSHSSRNE